METRLYPKPLFFLVVLFASSVLGCRLKLLAPVIEKSPIFYVPVFSYARYLPVILCQNVRSDTSTYLFLDSYIQEYLIFMCVFVWFKTIYI